MCNLATNCIRDSFCAMRARCGATSWCFGRLWGACFYCDTHLGRKKRRVLFRARSKREFCWRRRAEEAINERPPCSLLRRPPGEDHRQHVHQEHRPRLRDGRGASLLPFPSCPGENKYVASSPGAWPLLRKSGSRIPGVNLTFWGASWHHALSLSSVAQLHFLWQFILTLEESAPRSASEIYCSSSKPSPCHIYWDFKRQHVTICVKLIGCN